MRAIGGFSYAAMVKFKLASCIVCDLDALGGGGSDRSFGSCR